MSIHTIQPSFIRDFDIQASYLIIPGLYFTDLSLKQFKETAFDLRKSLRKKCKTFIVVRFLAATSCFLWLVLFWGGLGFFVCFVLFCSALFCRKY